MFPVGSRTAFYRSTPIRKGGKFKREEMTMKTIALRLSETAALSLAAILLLTSGAASASAQDSKVTGNIPFAFSADRSALEPGDYEIVSLNPNANVVKLYNPANRKAVFVGVIDRITTRNAAPRAEFLCGTKGCHLVRVFNGTDGWEIVQPNGHPIEKGRLLAVNLTPEPPK
jgi:hypothetical protein